MATTAARAAAALVTTTTAAFATAALAAAATHRETAAATATTMREQVAEATTERTTMATAARLTAAAAGRGAAAVATTAAAVASEPESISAARNGQHGHDQSKAMKIHLTHLHLRTRLHAADVRHLANPESRACSASVGRDKRAGETVRFVAPMAPIGGKMTVVRAIEGSARVPGATPQN
jgi:hypothetical protein